MNSPTVVFEDETVLVINKPAGWVVNRIESSSATLIQDWVERYLIIAKPDKRQAQEDNFFSRSGLVHRLDKETSGLLLVAKNPKAFERLQLQFAQREVKKRYLALVHGLVEGEEEIQATVGRLPWNRQRFGTTSPGGKEARTRYRALQAYKEPHPKGAGQDKYKGQLTLLELSPQSGRTHQIRVHLRSINHPVVSDLFYAGRKTARLDRLWCPRLFLHAQYLGFSHPKTNEWVEFSLNLPDDLQQVLDSLH